MPDKLHGAIFIFTFWVIHHFLMCPATSVVKQNAALCFAVKLQKLTSPDVPWHWGESIITEMNFWMNYFFSDVSLFCINLWMMCFDKMIIYFVL